MSTALLVLDVQNDFFVPENPNLAVFEAAVRVINETIAACRQHCAPVAFVLHTSHNKPKGSKQWALYDEIDCASSDSKIAKSSQNAFWRSGLHTQLKPFHAETLVIAGFLFWSIIGLPGRSTRSRWAAKRDEQDDERSR